MKDWFTSEVIPQVRQISLEIAAKLGREAGAPVEEQRERREEALEDIGIRTFHQPEPVAGSTNSDVLARLDAIILQAVLLKQEIQKIK